MMTLLSGKENRAEKLSLKILKNVSFSLFIFIDLKNDSSERYLNFNGIWQKEKSAYIVNGYLFKKDSNLITNFNFDEIPGYGIAIGPYPQTINDVEKLSNYGVKSVFWVQSKHDFHHRGINIENKRYIIKF